MARLKDLAEGTKDLFMLDPRIIQKKPGWNVRLAGPDLDAHIRQLADSIKEIGVQEPVTVYLEGETPYLTNGHCRLDAVMLAIGEGAEIKSIPARSEERYANDADRVLSMLTRNSGKPLSTIEQAEVVKRLLAFGWSESEVAKKTGISITHVSNMIRLLSAPQEVRTLVQEGKVSATLANDALKENGDAAGEVLTKAVETAQQAGKKRATKKHVVVTPATNWKKVGPELKELVGAMVNATGNNYMEANRKLVEFYRSTWPGGDQ